MRMPAWKNSRLIGEGQQASLKVNFSLAEIEKQTIIAAILSADGDILQASKLLGLGKTTVYRKVKSYRKGGPLNSTFSQAV